MQALLLASPIKSVSMRQYLEQCAIRLFFEDFEHMECGFILFFDKFAIGEAGLFLDHRAGLPKCAIFSPTLGHANLVTRISPPKLTMRSH